MASRSVNKVILLGNLGKDAETKFTPSGISVSKFSLATNRRSKDQQTGEWKETTDWHNIVMWRTENVANYLLKGKKIHLEGRIESRSYEDKEGQKKYITEVVCEANNAVLPGGGPRRRRPWRFRSRLIGRFRSTGFHAALGAASTACGGGGRAVGRIQPGHHGRRRSVLATATASSLPDAAIEKRSWARRIEIRIGPMPRRGAGWTSLTTISAWLKSSECRHIP